MDTKEVLIASGGALLRTSLDEWRKAREGVSITLAGMGVEHLLKAALSSIHPLLISGKDDKTLRYHAVGHGDVAKGGFEKAKTIGMAEAVRECFAFIGEGLTVAQAEIDPLIDARNGYAHLGYYKEGSGIPLLRVAIAVSEQLATYLLIPPGEIWERHSFRKSVMLTGASGRYSSFIETGGPVVLDDGSLVYENGGHSFRQRDMAV